MHIKYLLVGLFLLLMDISYKSVQSFIMECPFYQLHFQKIIGFRPELTYISNDNKFVIDRNNNANESLNLDCWNICQNDDECSSYVYIIDQNECYGFSKIDKSLKYQFIPFEIELIPDTNAVYFEKICLNVPPDCKSKSWPITKIPGSSLMFQGRKTIQSLVTKRECAEFCLFEDDFKCLSASFTPSYKNNQARFRSLDPRRFNVGRCILSDKDKTIQPDAYRTGLLFNEEYIENQCKENKLESISCSYEYFSNSSFLLPEAKYYGLTQTECQENCTNENRFHCRGASYIPQQNEKFSECYLHSEELLSMGPRGLKLQSNSLYLRRVKCLNVTVECNNEEMIVNYTPNDWFRGKLYANSHINDCSINGDGFSPLVLRFPIGTEEREKQCGILRAYQFHKSYQRSFITTLVIIQSNPNVETQSDRIIKVGCITKVPLSIIPDPLALGSNWTTNETNSNETGRSLNYDENEFKSNITMQIIDLNKQYQTNDVRIGQNLQFNIIESPINHFYDFQVIKLIAKSNGQSFELIDENGCPTDSNIFPKLNKIIENNKKILQANFNAFKFAGTSLVSFDANIKFCPVECPPLNCNALNYYNQRRKRDENNYDGIVNGVKVKNTVYVASTADKRTIEGSATEGPILEAPLRLNINVHSPEDMDSLDNSGLIIAKTVESDNLCVNQSLLIALLIFGLLLQIILVFICCFYIVKYKKLKNFYEDRNSLNAIHENLSYIEGNRRVHWADNNGFVF